MQMEKGSSSQYFLATENGRDSQGICVSLSQMAKKTKRPKYEQTKLDVFLTVFIKSTVLHTALFENVQCACAFCGASTGAMEKGNKSFSSLSLSFGFSRRCKLEKDACPHRPYGTVHSFSSSRGRRTGLFRPKHQKVIHSSVLLPCIETITHISTRPYLHLGTCIVLLRGGRKKRALRPGKRERAMIALFFLCLSGGDSPAPSTRDKGKDHPQGYTSIPFRVVS